MADYVATLKDLRVQIDHALQEVKAVKNTAISGQREIALSYTKMQEAKMWIGKALEEQGHELPVEYQDKYKGNDNEQV